MDARGTRTARRWTPARWPGLAAALLACTPALAAEPPPAAALAAATAATLPRSAWQRAQHGPTDAITLVRERQAAQGAADDVARPAAPRSGFVAERGGIAFQLEGGGRITVRRRHGTPMLFYRNDF